MDAEELKAIRQKTAALASAGNVAAKKERQEWLLENYDCSESMLKNCVRAGVAYNTVWGWMSREPEFKARLEAKQMEYRKRMADKIEDVVVKAAMGEVYTETIQYDGEGQVKQVTKHQQPPSYKHGELALRAFDPDTYARVAGGEGVNININLLPAQAAEGQRIDYVDLSDDPGKEMLKAPEE